MCRSKSQFWRIRRVVQKLNIGHQHVNLKKKQTTFEKVFAVALTSSKDTYQALTAIPFKVGVDNIYRKCLFLQTYETGSCRVLVPVQSIIFASNKCFIHCFSPVLFFSLLTVANGQIYKNVVFVLSFFQNQKYSRIHQEKNISYFPWSFQIAHTLMALAKYLKFVAN